MFIAVSQGSKSAKFLQTDQRRMAGMYEKKQKLFTRICCGCLDVWNLSCHRHNGDLNFNSNSYFKDLVRINAHFLAFFVDKQPVYIISVFSDLLQ